MTYAIAGYPEKGTEMAIARIGRVICALLLLLALAGAAAAAWSDHARSWASQRLVAQESPSTTAPGPNNTIWG
jgi:hypothetical protein